MFPPPPQPQQMPPGAPQMVPGGGAPPMAPPQAAPAQGAQSAPGAPVTIDAVMELLRDGVMRRFRIDIEVDSTITGDESQERNDRNQFIQTTTAFVKEWGPIVAAQPLMADLAGELLLFGTRAFRVGRSLEEVIEETVDKLEQQAAAPKPPPQPNPVEMEKTKQALIKTQAEGAKAQSDVQATQVKAGAQVKAAQMDLFAKALDGHHEAQKHQMGLRQMAAEELAAQQEQQRQRELADIQQQQAMQAARQPKGES